MNKSVLKRCIVLAWIFLIICLAIKLCGGNWFEIVVKDERFIRVGDYIDKHAWARLFIALLLGYFEMVLVFMVVCEKQHFNYKSHIMFVSCIILSILVKTFIGRIAGIFFDICKYSVIPLIFTRKWKRIILGIILPIVFQLISIITKNIGIKFIDDNVLISIIFSIDYYIMIILYLMHSKFIIKEK